MERREAIKVVEKIAMEWLGKPYVWGGDDPVDGFDCSGFVIELYKSAGLLPRKGDWTANGLFRYFDGCEVDQAEAGALVFWQNSTGKITHVEYCINETLSIGASGGGSKTKTTADAIKQNAYIKVRPIYERPRKIAGFVQGFKRQAP